LESHLQSLIDYFSMHPHIALASVFAAALLEALAVVGTVIPGSSVVFIGGALIGLKMLDPWWTLAAAVVGAILGDGLSFWLGHRYHAQIRTLWPMRSHPELFDRGQVYFAKNGGKSVFVARFLGPLRAIVPVVAGMSNMPAGQFYAMNILSALAWAAAHILPGVLFGASLQLAGAVSSRLVVLFVMIVAVVWATSKLVRFAIGRGWPRIKSLRDRAVARAREKSGLLSRVVLSLFDPTRPESQSLLIGGIVLIGGAWLFLGVLEDVIANDPLVRFDRTVYDFLQSVRTAWGDNLMVAFTEMGGAVATIPVIVSMSVLLAFNRYWRTLGYWLAAAGFAEMLVWMLKSALGRTRPSSPYAGVEHFSFPSGHATLAIVVYGFAAFLLTRGRTAGIKMAIMLPVALAIMLIAFSRLYLGVHWFSDVAAGLSLGLAWVALLGIAYAHHVHDERLTVFQPALVILMTLALVGALYVSNHHGENVALYVKHPREPSIVLGDWKGADWRGQPAARSELGSEPEEPFSVQWAGTAGQISGELIAAGWQTPKRWTSKALFLWLLPDKPIEVLPVLPKFDHGEPQALTFVKPTSRHERIVVRFWPSRDVVDASPGTPLRPLWNGTATIERLHRLSGFITLATTGADFVTPLNFLEQDVKKRYLAVENRTRGDEPILLVW